MIRHLLHFPSRWHLVGFLCWLGAIGLWVTGRISLNVAGLVVGGAILVAYYGSRWSATKRLDAGKGETATTGL